MARMRGSPRSRVAGALLLVGLAFLAAYALQLREQEPEPVVREATDRPSAPLELDRFSARLERTNEIDRLAVSVRLRANLVDPVTCFVFVVARTERSPRKAWAIWPPSSPGMAISAGGHFHGAHPASGHALDLGGAWQRVDAVIPMAKGQAPFDTIAVYVVAPNGHILLARPFAM